MKVYFNNSCKICRAEINLYKKENIKEIDWVDITNNSNAEIETSKNDIEQRFDIVLYSFEKLGVSKDK